MPVVPGTFYAIGSNYRDHIEKMAQAAGRKPIYYDRPRRGLSRQQRAHRTRRGYREAANSTEEFQYEAELVAVIGKPGRNVTPEQARDMIFGWTIGNDVSERTWQRSDPPISAPRTATPSSRWAPSFCKAGTCATCAPRSASTAVGCHSFDTGNMIFDAAAVVSEISKYNTLSPGDVVWLGTDDKPHNLNIGDVLEIEITGIGLLRNQVVAEKPRQ